MPRFLLLIFQLRAPSDFTPL